MAADYVSPFDERVRAAEPLAPRPASIRGRRVVLLDIRKNRGAEFLDRIETLLQAAGAATARTTKEIFSKPGRPRADRRHRRTGRPGRGGPRRLRLMHVVQFA